MQNVRDLDFCEECNSVLRHGAERLRASTLRSMERKVMRKTLINLKNFLLQQEKSDDSSAHMSDDSIQTSFVNPQKDRQKMLRDQGCLMQIFAVMRAPFTPDACSGCNGVLIDDMNRLAQEDDRFSWVVNIMRLCYSIIKVGGPIHVYLPMFPSI